jgi:hypothetical protein
MMDTPVSVFRVMLGYPLQAEGWRRYPDIPM